MKIVHEISDFLRLKYQRIFKVDGLYRLEERLKQGLAVFSRKLIENNFYRQRPVGSGSMMSPENSFDDVNDFPHVVAGMRNRNKKTAWFHDSGNFRNDLRKKV